MNDSPARADPDADRDRAHVRLGGDGRGQLHPAGRRLHQRDDRQHRAVRPGGGARVADAGQPRGGLDGGLHNRAWPRGPGSPTGFKARAAKRDRGDEDGPRCWPPTSSGPLRAELVLLAGFTAGWEASGGRPAGWGQFCLLAVAAAAMGVQSSAVRDMGLSEVSDHLPDRDADRAGGLAGPGRARTRRTGCGGSACWSGCGRGASLSGLLRRDRGGRRCRPCRWPRWSPRSCWRSRNGVAVQPRATSGHGMSFRHLRAPIMGGSAASAECHCGGVSM